MSAPFELQARGREIYAAFNADSLPAGNRALVMEAARCADLLDKLDGLIQGDQSAWLKLVFDDMGEVTLSMDGVVGERRQQQMALRQLMSEIRQAGIKQAAGEEKTPNGRGGLILELQRDAG